jgi:three-Cys-motif partner protein
MAGEPENADRDTGELFDGSPVVALGAQPGFTRHRFIEMDPQRASDLDTYLRLRFPHKDLEVVPGDCNNVLPSALTSLLPYRWAPTFAFLDQQAADIDWCTLETLAHFEPERSHTKVELWMLFPAGMAHVRKLPRRGQVRPADVEKLDRHFGCTHWQAIQDAYLDGLIEGPDRR